MPKEVITRRPLLWSISCGASTFFHKFSTDAQRERIYVRGGCCGMKLSKAVVSKDYDVVMWPNDPSNQDLSSQMTSPLLKHFESYYLNIFWSLGEVNDNIN